MIVARTMVRGSTLVEIDRAISNFDWDRAMRIGAEQAREFVYRGTTVNEEHAMWALLVEAAKTTARAYAPPPRSGFPGRSAMPEAPDDVNYWTQMRAYLQGEIEEIPETKAAAPQPSAEQITRAEAVLLLWHHFALRHKGDRSRIKRAVYLCACGVKSIKVQRATNMKRQQLHSARQEAMRDMLEVIARC